MTKIAVHDFARRQTPESQHNHFGGTWEELIELVSRHWPRRRISPHNPEVALVPMPENQLHRFYAGIVEVTSETPLEAVFAPRVAGEDPYIQVASPGGKKTPAKKVDIVCYSHEVLAKDGDAPAVKEADYYIININAYATDEEEPMRPMTMARNLLGLKGGTKPEVAYSPEEFARAIVYWSRHVRVGE